MSMPKLIAFFRVANDSHLYSLPEDKVTEEVYNLLNITELMFAETEAQLKEFELELEEDNKRRCDICGTDQRYKSCHCYGYDCNNDIMDLAFQ